MGSAVEQMAALTLSAAIGDHSVCEMDVNENSLRTGLCGDVMNLTDGQVLLFDSSGLVCVSETTLLAKASLEHVVGIIRIYGTCIFQVRLAMLYYGSWQNHCRHRI